MHKSGSVHFEKHFRLFNNISFAIFPMLVCVRDGHIRLDTCKDIQKQKGAGGLERQIFLLFLCSSLFLVSFFCFITPYGKLKKKVLHLMAGPLRGGRGKGPGH